MWVSETCRIRTKLFVLVSQNRSVGRFNTLEISKNGRWKRGVSENCKISVIRSVTFRYKSTASNKIDISNVLKCPTFRYWLTNTNIWFWLDQWHVADSGFWTNVYPCSIYAKEICGWKKMCFNLFCWYKYSLKTEPLWVLCCCVN
jgi:hypothetical protein